MSTFARITAFVLIVLGILNILGGLVLAALATLGATGAARALLDVTTATRPLRAGGSPGLIAVAFSFIEGLTVTAIGEGLYLLADLPNKLPPPDRQTRASICSHLGPLPRAT